MTRTLEIIAAEIAALRDQSNKMLMDAGYKNSPDTINAAWLFDTGPEVEALRAANSEIHDRIMDLRAEHAALERSITAEIK